MSKIEFYTARYDAGFKNALGCESQKELLKYFLEKTLNLKIKELIIDLQELEKPNIKIKTKTLDVLVKTEEETINIEINNGYHDYLPIRNYAYISSVFSSSVFKGESYLDTKMHIQLNITWGLGLNKPIYNCYTMYDKDNDSCYCDKLKIIEINMDKIMNMWYHGDKEKALEYKYFLMLDLEPKD
ncbi:MAG: PD-(D/E)XK nuclease family transposase, partial [Bacilli bacterium]